MSGRIVCLTIALGGALHGQTDLKTLEARAEAQFSAHDCASAEKTFAEALQVAQASGELRHTGTYYMRIGNCRTRLGDFTASLDAYSHAVAFAESIGDDAGVALGLHGSALQLMKLGRIAEALPMGKREYELAQKVGNPVHIVRAMWLLAAQYSATGHVRDSINMLNRAWAINRTNNDPPMTSVLLGTLAIEYIGVGDLETAAYMEKQILAIPQDQLNSTATTYSPAITYNNLGEILRKSGHLAEARKSFEKAVESSTAADEWRVHAGALLNLAEMQSVAGQIAESDDGFRQALAIADKLNYLDLQTEVHQMRSDSLLARGDVRGASEDAAEALRLARQGAVPARVYQALLSRGSASDTAGQTAAARADFDEALQIAETLRAGSPGEVSDLNGAFANLIPLYQASVRNLIELNLPEEALQRAEQAKARVLMDILLRGGVDERGVMTSAEAAEQDKARKRLTAANAAASGSPSAAATRTLEEAMVAYRQTRRDLYAKHPELAVQSADFEPAGAEAVPALLRGPKSALLDYFLVPSGVALFVVRETGVTVHLLPDPKHTLAAEARSFREQIANRELGYKTAAQRLFNRLLGPAMVDLRGTTDWVVSPDGALWDIPFEALVDPAGQHVIETRSVVLTPSLTADLEMRRRRESGSGGIRLLAMGNPLPSPEPLPDAAREVAEISANYPHGSALVLTGALATVAEFRDRRQGPV